jgi:hypothetical protein
MQGTDVDGTGRAVLVEDTGAMIISQGGKYRAATEAGRVYAAANQAVVTNTAGLAAANTGLSLCNPTGSGKNFAILGLGIVAEIALPTAVCVMGIMTGGGVGAATKVIVARNRLSGGPASVANVDSAVTFTETPVLEQVFFSMHTGAATTGLQDGLYIDIDGSLIVTPGYHCTPYHSAVNAVTFQFSWLWEEYTP